LFRKIRNRKGFTIIELIVVMGVLAILVAMGVPRYLGYTKDAAVTAMKADSKLLEQAAYQYALNNDDVWPAGTAIDLATTTDIADEVKTFLSNSGITGDVYEIDETLVAPYIRSTKNPISSYFIITAPGDFEGVVMSKNALPDSKGDLFSGLYKLN
jgi:general secretion pathway protein G